MNFKQMQELYGNDEACWSDDDMSVNRHTVKTESKPYRPKKQHAPLTRAKKPRAHPAPFHPTRVFQREPQKPRAAFHPTRAAFHRTRAAFHPTREPRVELHPTRAAFHPTRAAFHPTREPQKPHAAFHPEKRTHPRQMKCRTVPGNR